MINKITLSLLFLSLSSINAESEADVIPTEDEEDSLKPLFFWSDEWYLKSPYFYAWPIVGLFCLIALITVILELKALIDEDYFKDLNRKKLEKKISRIPRVQPYKQRDLLGSAQAINNNTTQDAKQMETNKMTCESSSMRDENMTEISLDSNVKDQIAIKI